MATVNKLFKGIIFIVLFAITFLFVGCLETQDSNSPFETQKANMKKLKQDVDMNYNNYLYGQRMDFFNGNLFLIGSGSLIKLADNKAEYVEKLNTKFQILNEKIYYIDNGNLVESTLLFKETKIIVEGVSQFLIFKSGFLYTKESSQYAETLFFKDTYGEEKEIYKEIEWFCIYKNGVLVLKENSLDDERYDVIEINIPKGTTKKITVIKSEDILDRLFLSNNNLVFYDTNVVKLLDLQTKEQRVIYTPPNGFFEIKLISNDSYVYVSVQEYGMDGSITFNKENDKNGLYRIDVLTNKISKIRNESYNDMYLFGGCIFGYKNSFSKNKLFQISESGDICSEIISLSR